MRGVGRRSRGGRGRGCGAGGGPDHLDALPPADPRGPRAWGFAAPAAGPKGGRMGLRSPALYPDGMPLSKYVRHELLTSDLLIDPGSILNAHMALLAALRDPNVPYLVRKQGSSGTSSLRGKETDLDLDRPAVFTDNSPAIWLHYRLLSGRGRERRPDRSGAAPPRPSGARRGGLPPRGVRSRSRVAPAQQLHGPCLPAHLDGRLEAEPHPALFPAGQRSAGPARRPGQGPPSRGSSVCGPSATCRPTTTSCHPCPSDTRCPSTAPCPRALTSARTPVSSTG